MLREDKLVEIPRFSETFDKLLFVVRKSKAGRVIFAIWLDDYREIKICVATKVFIRLMRLDEVS